MGKNAAATLIIVGTVLVVGISLVFGGAFPNIHISKPFSFAGTQPLTTILSSLTISNTNANSGDTVTFSGQIKNTGTVPVTVSTLARFCVTTVQQVANCATATTYRVGSTDVSVPASIAPGQSITVTSVPYKVIGGDFAMTLCSLEGGNCRVLLFSIKTDSIGPAIAAVIKPLAPTFADLISVSVIAQDASKVSSISISTDSTLAKTCVPAVATSSLSCATIPTTYVAATHSYSVTAKDAFGNTNTIYGNFAVGVAPVLSVRYIDRTATEIVIAWDPILNATSYVVERTTPPNSPTDLRTYTVDASSTVFADTGWSINSPNRFIYRSNDLNPSQQYYYRVKAKSGDTIMASSGVIGPFQLANFTYPSQIVRGIANDFYADVVLGQPRFGENTWFQTDAYHAQFGGGVVVDKNTLRPTRLFLIDSNHNRVLGVDHLGACSGGTQNACSIDSDCDKGFSCKLTPGNVAPKFVLGQPSADNIGSCNGDSTAQTFPNRPPASAATMCLMLPTQISVGETVIILEADVDKNHNFYVPDSENSRVLMYKDPFNVNNGSAAAEVWGQDTFSGNLCNKGSVYLSSSALCKPRGVTIDTLGNLWVADGIYNNRVLRFPKDPLTSIPSKTSDLILTGIWHPVAVRVDTNGDVYVSTEKGFFKFLNPKPGLSNIPQELTFMKQDSDLFWGSHMAFDPTSPRHMWMQIGSHVAGLYDLDTGVLLKKVQVGELRGIDVSQSGDLFSVTPWDHIYGLYRLSSTQSITSGKPLGDAAFLGYGIPNNGSMNGVLSITTAGSQLLISDLTSVHIWNDFRSITHGTTLTKPADGEWGLIKNGEGDYTRYGYVVKSDASGRIWIGDLLTHQLKIFTQPLTSSSLPTKTVSITSYKDSSGSIVPLPPGASISLANFFPVGSGDGAWIADDDHFRVVRVVNIDGLAAPGKPPYIDMVLGQADWNGTKCNKGGGPYAYARDTFCREGLPVMDPAGNLYVEDNADGGDDGGTTRILRWDAITIPNPATLARTLFNLLPSRVYGSGGSANFTRSSATSDPAHTPRAPAFDSVGRMVLGGANPYTGARYPLVYLNSDELYPQFALGDFVSFPSASYVDPDGNLYLGDYDWSRVLVYKTPFAKFSK